MAAAIYSIFPSNIRIARSPRHHLPPPCRWRYAHNLHWFGASLVQALRYMLGLHFKRQVASIGSAERTIAKYAKYAQIIAIRSKSKKPAFS
jgi:hypothetical protein